MAANERIEIKVVELEAEEVSVPKETYRDGMQKRPMSEPESFRCLEAFLKERGWL